MPGYRAAQVRTLMPHGQQTAILQARDVKTPFLDMAYSAQFKLRNLTGNHFAAKSAWILARLQEVKQSRPGLAEKADYRDCPGVSEETAA